jgi:hypothetical protein
MPQRRELEARVPGYQGTHDVAAEQEDRAGEVISRSVETEAGEIERWLQCPSQSRLGSWQLPGRFLLQTSLTNRLSEERARRKSLCAKRG